MENLTNKTEFELRDFKVPFEITKEEFLKAYEELTDRQHDYGTCVYAMSIIAEMGFNMVANKLGVTGFQSSCADLDFIRRTRRMEAGFKIIDFSKLLYPQYKDNDFIESFDELIVKNKEALKPLAIKRLKEDDGFAHEDVINHWKYIANLA